MSEFYPAQEQEVEKNIDLHELFHVLISRVIWIVLAVAICITGAYFYTKETVVPTYRSSATLRFARGNMNSAADIAMATYMAADFSRMVTERLVLEDVIEDLELGMSYGALRSKIGVSYRSEDRIVTVSVVDVDPDRARVILDTVCTATKDVLITNDAMETYHVWGVSFPADPVGSPIVRNMTTAGILGFVCSVAIIVVLYLVDDKIKTPDHIQRVLGISTLGTIPYARKQERKRNQGGER